MIAMIYRNCLLYFRNRSGVFFSLLGAGISFILYLLFLQKNMQSSWAQEITTTSLLDSWLLGGTLAITGITTTLAAMSQLVKDRQCQISQDLALTDISSFKRTLSYLISATIVGSFMQVIIFSLIIAYFAVQDSYQLNWSILPMILLVMLFSAFISAFFSYLMLYRVQQTETLDKISSIVGTASGFLVGVYLPIGILPNFAQLLMKLTPGAYVASIYRQLLMKNQLSSAFQNHPHQQINFEKILGVRLQWGTLLTLTQTTLFLATLFIGFLVLLAIDAFIQKKQQTKYFQR